MICSNYKCFPIIRKRHINERLVFCTGSFDLVHSGHVLFFEDCKKFGDVLMVGVGNDSIIEKLKGKNRPILNQHVRLKMIDSLKPVDYCFLDESTNRDHPLKLIEEAFKKLRPNVYVINEDAFDIGYRRMLAKKYGIKMVILKRIAPSKFEGISTSKIIEKIKRI